MELDLNRNEKTAAVFSSEDSQDFRELSIEELSLIYGAGRSSPHFNAEMQ